MKRALALSQVTLLHASMPDWRRASATPDDPVLGTWKLNVEKSKFIPGPRLAEPDPRIPKHASRNCGHLDEH